MDSIIDLDLVDSIIGIDIVDSIIATDVVDLIVGLDVANTVVFISRIEFSVLVIISSFPSDEAISNDSNSLSIVEVLDSAFDSNVLSKIDGLGSALGSNSLFIIDLLTNTLEIPDVLSIIVELLIISELTESELVNNKLMEDASTILLVSMILDISLVNSRLEVTAAVDSLSMDVLSVSEETLLFKNSKEDISPFSALIVEGSINSLGSITLISTGVDDTAKDSILVVVTLLLETVETDRLTINVDDDVDDARLEVFSTSDDVKILEIRPELAAELAIGLVLSIELVIRLELLIELASTENTKVKQTNS